MKDRARRNLRAVEWIGLHPSRECGLIKTDEDSSSSVEPHNLRALKTEACHQPALIERESINAAVQRISGKTAGHPFIHNHHGRARADLPAACVVYPIDCVLIHQEESVTVLLNACLQPVRSRYRAIASINSSALKKN